MLWTGIADKDHILLNTVVGITTWLDGVAVVDATADSVAFGDTNTHDGDNFVRDSCFSINRSNW